jgi:hypothetical protein
MGLWYEDLALEQPRLIYARTSGYGLRGEESERPALDPVGQARAGMFYASGEPGDPPNWISFAFADVMGASMLATASSRRSWPLSARVTDSSSKRRTCKHRCGWSTRVSAPASTPA